MLPAMKDFDLTQEDLTESERKHRFVTAEAQWDIQVLSDGSLSVVMSDPEGRIESLAIVPRYGNSVMIRAIPAGN